MSTTDKKLHWKVLKSEYLFTEPWFTVRRDTVKLPNGHQIPSYYVTEYPDRVNVIAITKAKQFVFVRRTVMESGTYISNYVRASARRKTPLP